MNNIILPVTSDFEQTAQWLKTIKIKNTIFYVGVTSKEKSFSKTQNRSKFLCLLTAQQKKK